MVVPRGSAKIRRFEVSRRKLRCAFTAAATFGIVVLIGTVSLFVYRHSYLKTEDVRVQSAEFMIEKAELLNRIAELEGSLSRMERFASKIERAMDVSSSAGSRIKSIAGRGPVDEESWLPVPDNSSANSIAGLGASTWRSPFSKNLGKGLKLSLDKLSDRIDRTEGKVHSVFALQRDKLHFWASLPTIWPTNGWITSEFGAARGWGGNGRRRHEGVDVAGPRGTPIIAPGSGVVTFTGYRRGYGKTVMVDHGYGIATLYGHCQSLLVDEGQPVKRGMVIATIGNTGRSTGPHLHYEVQVEGVPVNPMLYIMNDL
jgi:hypothetical protein